MIKLRWIVLDGTSTEPPKLQYMEFADGSDCLWHDVPVMTVSQAYEEDNEE